MQIVIPTRGRSEILGECALKIFPGALVCCSEAEAEVYARVTKNLLVHPDSVETLPLKRQWILDQLDDEVVVQVDDDMRHCRSLASRNTSSVIGDPDAIMQIVENAMMCAKGAGAGMFGFANIGDLRYYRPQLPFRLASWVGQVVGFIGRDLRSDGNIKMRGDLDLCFQSLLRHRIIWQDSRFWFESKWKSFEGKGGNSHLRGNSQQEDDLKILKRKWGAYFHYRRTMLSEAGGKTKLKFKVVRSSGRIL